MIIVLTTPDGKKLVCNTKRDERVYTAPVNPPNTGSKYTRGTDLLLHKSRSGQQYFYLEEWSMWAGEGTSYHLITTEEAKEFLLGKLQGDQWDSLEGKQLQRAEELFPDLLDETG